jgi:hypothetical protein
MLNIISWMCFVMLFLMLNILFLDVFCDAFSGVCCVRPFLGEAD